MVIFFEDEAEKLKMRMREIAVEFFQARDISGPKSILILELIDNPSRKLNAFLHAPEPISANNWCILVKKNYLKIGLKISAGNGSFFVELPSNKGMIKALDRLRIHQKVGICTAGWARSEKLDLDESLGQILAEIQKHSR